MIAKKIGILAISLLVMMVAAGTAIAPATPGVDIKPYSQPNSINVKANGEIPVAILTQPGFDAAAIDPTTVLLAGEFAPVEKKGVVKAALEDADGDGDLDMVLHFKPDRDELPGLVVGDGAIQVDGDKGTIDGYLNVTGMTYSGTDFIGMDTVRLLHVEF